MDDLRLFHDECVECLRQLVEINRAFIAASADISARKYSTDYFDEVEIGEGLNHLQGVVRNARLLTDTWLPLPAREAMTQLPVVAGAVRHVGVSAKKVHRACMPDADRNQAGLAKICASLGGSHRDVSTFLHDIIEGRPVSAAPKLAVEKFEVVIAGFIDGNVGGDGAWGRICSLYHRWFGGREESA